MSGWDVALDRGGTFVDVVARRGGEERTGKILARTGRELADVAALLGGMHQIRSLRIGTTVATNALLTASGVSVGLITNLGLEDLTRIGHQSRAAIFSLQPSRESLLAMGVRGIPGRLSAAGEQIEPLDRARTLAAARSLLADGAEAIAVALLHSVSEPSHEDSVVRWLAEEGIEALASHSVLPRVGLVDRSLAVVMDAHLTPVVREFVSRVSHAAPEARSSLYMTSDGDLVPGAWFTGKDALLSGPAGGVSACARVARELGLDAVLGFDMGGTSTDVSRWSGQVERRPDTELAGRTVPFPGMDVVSVAAGGGSRLTHQDGRFQVGPESAGSEPGPAAYGQGGPATVSDANLILGRLQPRWAPRVFGVDGDRPLDPGAAAAALALVSPEHEPEQAAWGFLRVANEVMAEAIASLSLARGHDPRAHALIAFGGAGPQHGCAVAERLGISEVVVHPLAGVLSAAGIASAPRAARVTCPLAEPWDDGLPSRCEALVSSAREQITARLGREPEQLELSFTLRYADAEASLQAGDRAEFEQAHERLFGFSRSAAPVEALALHVRGALGDDLPAASAPPDGGPRRPQPVEHSSMVVAGPSVGAGVRRDVPVYRWAELLPGDRLPGPALVVSDETVVVVEPGWTLMVWTGAVLRLRRGARRRGPHRDLPPPAPDPVGLELAQRRLMGIATAMGETLRRVAWSTNIRERLDFSCAVFDAEGQLLANAPHIPVHLGAMGETVRCLKRELAPSELRPGRAWAVNDPARGGSHLPDITVVTPVFADEGDEAPFAFVASRGHHSDVGGVTPGSMPPFSTRLEEEGVLLRRLLLLDEGRLQEDAIRAALADSPWPARDPSTVVADLAAQIAANRLGAIRLGALREQLGARTLSAWMGFVLDNGDAILCAWAAGLPGPTTFSDAMDDGTELRVCLRPSEAGLDVDFAGTGAAGPHNLNVPSAVVRAATLYVLRCAMGRDVPLNEGVLRSVRFALPPGSLLAPPSGAAVVGGNVETSQRIVDVLLGALELAAASQGTMNNLCFGDASSAYYETICGGAGATARGPGSSGIQTHMTNTRITDPEVLEARHPVRLERFALRSGSGGAGAHRGGEGVERVLRFLEDRQVSLLSQRRTRAPFGVQGGGPGAVGSARWLRATGEVTLPANFAIEVAAGEGVAVLTPGGGGYGPPDAEEL